MVEKDIKKPLYDIILVPEIFKIGDNKTNERDVFDLFKVLKNNSVVLIDRDDQYIKLILDYINSCSPKYKDALLKHFKQLKIQKRLINIFKTGTGKENEKSIFDYDFYYAQIKSHNYDFIFVNDVCKDVCSDKYGLDNLISVSDLPIDPMIEKCFERTGEFEVQDKSDKKTFENYILIPLVRYAKHIKLIDRYIGRHFHEDRKTSEQLDTLKDVEYILKDDRYLKCIGWIFDIIAENSKYQANMAQTNGNKSYPTVEVFTGLQTDLINEQQRTSIIEFFGKLEQLLRDRYKFDIKIYLKNENAQAKMPHERLFVTDQIITQIDRGFNLLKPNNTMMGTLINVIDIYDEQEIRTLDDLL